MASSISGIKQNRLFHSFNETGESIINFYTRIKGDTIVYDRYFYVRSFGG